MGTEVICWVLGVLSTGSLLCEAGFDLPVGGDQMWVNWLLRGGVVALSMLVLWLVITGKLVPGYIHKAVCKENEQLKSQNLGMVAMGGAECNEDLVNHLKKELREHKEEVDTLRTQLSELTQVQDENNRFRKELSEAKRLGQAMRDGK
jgi:hypothetical protein